MVSCETIASSRTLSWSVPQVFRRPRRLRPRGSSCRPGLGFEFARPRRCTGRGSRGRGRRPRERGGGGGHPGPPALDVGGGGGQGGGADAPEKEAGETFRAGRARNDEVGAPFL